MAVPKPTWIKVAIPLAIIFGLVGLVAGGWFMAFLIVPAIIVLMLAYRRP
jgi:predicted ABC-type sugar transport system permease subunit